MSAQPQVRVLDRGPANRAGVLDVPRQDDLVLHREQWGGPKYIPREPRVLGSGVVRMGAPRIAGMRSYRSNT
jgi:hypothetical protein